MTKEKAYKLAINSLNIMSIKENQQEWFFDKKTGVGMAVHEGLAQVIQKNSF